MSSWAEYPYVRNTRSERETNETSTWQFTILGSMQVGPLARVFGYVSRLALQNVETTFSPRLCQASTLHANPWRGSVLKVWQHALPQAIYGDPT